MRSLLSAVAVSLLAAGPLAAQVPTPARPVTDPASVASPTRPPVRPLPIEDIGTTRGLYRSVWSADGRQLFLSTNLTGRFNLWRIEAAGSFPVQLTQSDDAQYGQVVTGDANGCCSNRTAAATSTPTSSASPPTAARSRT
jgi:hypothetical protein